MAKKEKKTTKKTAKKKKPSDPFSRLTWDDLDEWAGTTIIARGRSYQRRGAVRDLALTQDGALLARVYGTSPYATQVTIQSRKSLDSVCSCPYWTTCKHAVAVVLEYLECLKQGKTVEQAEEDDPRLEELEGLEEEFDEDEMEEYDEDYDEDDEDFDEDDEEETEESGDAIRPTGSGKKNAALKTYLQEHTKAELVSLLEELAAQHPEVRQQLEDRRTLSSGQTRKILQNVRQEIAAISEPAWDQHGYGGYSGGDVKRLRDHLEALVQAGQADDVVRLGPELLGACVRAVESYDQEGEVGDELEPCLAAVFQALPHSSLPPAEQLEWVMDMNLQDGYGLCDSGLEQFWKTRFSKADWGALAQRLQQRLEEHDSPAAEDDFSSRFGRDQLSNWLIRALENAGRKDEIIPLCEREAPITSSYDRLVDRLMAAKRWEEAERWCHAGIAATESGFRGSTSLRHKLRAISEKTGDRLRAIAFGADEFFSSPSLNGFQELCKAARKARVGPSVEAWARHYLETGRKPASGRKRKSDPDRAWSLPKTGIEPPPSPRMSQAPLTDVLIQLAMAEKKPDEALKWFDHPRHKKDRGIYSSSLDLQVAEAVKSAHPDRAVAIWKKTAEQHIATVQVKGYEAAAPHLRKVKQALTRKGRKKEWETYLNKLRQQNLRRPRCVEVLDRLAGIRKRIIDS